MPKEQNFISAVVCLYEYSEGTEKFFRELITSLEMHFERYEIISVMCGNGDNAAEKLLALKNELNITSPITVINMSLRQSREQCLNAGLDMSIGDYVYEFETSEGGFDSGLIWEAYEAALTGNDIVTVCPKKENPASRIFYALFNSYSRALYPIRTNAFRLISRRALNRVNAANANISYRKAVYSASGLKTAEIEFDGSVDNREQDKTDLAVNSLVLYTDFGYKFSLQFACFMMLATLSELAYTCFIWFTGSPVSGWTTIMFSVTFGLSGLFAVLALMLKYLTLIIRLLSDRQNYLVENIKKI